MIQSSKPRKQRLFRYTAPLHNRQRMMHAHVDKAAAAKLGIRRRSIELRRGDTVKIVSGSSKGKAGKVMGVDLRTGKVLVEGIVRKNAKGKESPLPIYASKVYITDLDMSDKQRQERVKARVQQ